eukprot:g25816.t1
MRPKRPKEENLNRLRKLIKKLEDLEPRTTGPYFENEDDPELEPGNNDEAELETDEDQEDNEAYEDHERQTAAELFLKGGTERFRSLSSRDEKEVRMALCCMFYLRAELTLRRTSEFLIFLLGEARLRLEEDLEEGERLASMHGKVQQTAIVLVEKLRENDQEMLWCTKAGVCILVQFQLGDARLFFARPSLQQIMLDMWQGVRPDYFERNWCQQLRVWMRLLLFGSANLVMVPLFAVAPGVESYLQCKVILRADQTRQEEEDRWKRILKKQNNQWPYRFEKKGKVCWDKEDFEKAVREECREQVFQVQSRMPLLIPRYKKYLAILTNLGFAAYLIAERPEGANVPVVLVLSAGAWLGEVAQLVSFANAKAGARNSFLFWFMDRVNVMELVAFTCIAWTTVLVLIDKQSVEFAQQFKALGVLFLGISQFMAMLRMSSVFGPLVSMTMNMIVDMIQWFVRWQLGGPAYEAGNLQLRCWRTGTSTADFELLWQAETSEGRNWEGDWGAIREATAGASKHEDLDTLRTLLGEAEKGTVVWEEEDCEGETAAELFIKGGTERFRSLSSRAEIDVRQALCCMFYFRVELTLRRTSEFLIFLLAEARVRLEEDLEEGERLARMHGEVQQTAIVLVEKLRANDQEMLWSTQAGLEILMKFQLGDARLFFARPSLQQIMLDVWQGVRPDYFQRSWCKQLQVWMWLLMYGIPNLVMVFLWAVAPEFEQYMHTQTISRADAARQEEEKSWHKIRETLEKWPKSNWPYTVESKKQAVCLEWPYAGAKSKRQKKCWDLAQFNKAIREECREQVFLVQCRLPLLIPRYKKYLAILTNLAFAAYLIGETPDEANAVAVLILSAGAWLGEVAQLLSFANSKAGAQNSFSFWFMDRVNVMELIAFTCIAWASVLCLIQQDWIEFAQQFKALGVLFLGISQCMAMRTSDGETPSDHCTSVPRMQCGFQSAATLHSSIASASCRLSAEWTSQGKNREGKVAVRRTSEFLIFLLGEARVRLEEDLEEGERLARMHGEVQQTAIVLVEKLRANDQEMLWSTQAGLVILMQFQLGDARLFFARPSLQQIMLDVWQGVRPDYFQRSWCKQLQVWMWLLLYGLPNLLMVFLWAVAPGLEEHIQEGVISGAQKAREDETSTWNNILKNLGEKDWPYRLGKKLCWDPEDFENAVREKCRERVFFVQCRVPLLISRFRKCLAIFTNLAFAAYLIGEEPRQANVPLVLILSAGAWLGEVSQLLSFANSDAEAQNSFAFWFMDRVNVMELVAFTCIGWTCVLVLIQEDWTEFAQQFKALGVLFLGISQSMAILRMSSVFGPLVSMTMNMIVDMIQWMMLLIPIIGCLSPETEPDIETEEIGAVLLETQSGAGAGGAQPKEKYLNGLRTLFREAEEGVVRDDEDHGGETAAELFIKGGTERFRSLSSRAETDVRKALCCMFYLKVELTLRRASEFLIFLLAEARVRLEEDLEEGERLARMHGEVQQTAIVLVEKLRANDQEMLWSTQAGLEILMQFQLGDARLFFARPSLQQIMLDVWQGVRPDYFQRSWCKQLQVWMRLLLYGFPNLVMVFLWAVAPGVEDHIRDTVASDAEKARREEEQKWHNILQSLKDKDWPYKMGKRKKVCWGSDDFEDALREECRERVFLIQCRVPLLISRYRKCLAIFSNLAFAAYLIGEKPSEANVPLVLILSAGAWLGEVAQLLSFANSKAGAQNSFAFWFMDRVNVMELFAFTCIGWNCVLVLIRTEWVEFAQQFKALGVLFLGISQCMAILRMSSVFGPLVSMTMNMIVDMIQWVTLLAPIIACLVAALITLFKTRDKSCLPFEFDYLEGLAQFFNVPIGEEMPLACGQAAMSGLRVPLLVASFLLSSSCELEACDDSDFSLRQLRARQFTNVSSEGCGGLDDPRNADCADAVQWAYEKGIKTHPGWYFIPLGKISQIGPADAKLNDLQRIFFCGRAGQSAPRCGLPPCGCSRPPCHMCEAPEVAPKLSKAFNLIKRFDFTGDPKREFDIVQLPDQNMTHSCSNYVDDGQTVFTSNGRLVLKVASACPDGSCLNSGRVMSRDAFTYGVFTFSAKVPKCNAVWPALWFLPQSSKGDGKLAETVNDDSHGAFNLVAGFGAAAGRCYDPAAVSCNACAPPSYCTSTTLADAEASHVLVEDTRTGWKWLWGWERKQIGGAAVQEHLFVLVWQPHEISAFLDPKLSFNSQGQLVAIQEKIRPGAPTFKTYQRDTTPTLFLGCRELYDEDRLGALVAAPSPGATPRVALSLVRRSPTHAKLLKLAQDGSQALSRKWLAKMPEVVRGDAELVREVLRRDGVALQYASEEGRAHPQLVLEAVRRSGFALEYAAEHLRGDRQFVLEAVKQNGFALARASAKLQGDPEVILAAIKEEGAAFEYAAQELKGDFDFALEVVSLGGPGAMKHISADLWEDPRFVLHAVRQAPSALEHAQAEVKAEPTFVLELLSRSPAALPFVAAELLEEMEGEMSGIEKVPKKFWTDRDFVLAAARFQPSVLNMVEPGWLKEQPFILSVLQRNSSCIRFVSEELLKDRAFVLQALRTHGSVLKHLPQEMRADPSLVLAAVPQTGFVLSFAADELRLDKCFVLQAVKINGYALIGTPEVMRSDREVVLAAVRQQGQCLEFATPALRADPEIVLAAIRSCPGPMAHVEECLWKDPAFVLEAAALHACAIQHADDALRLNRPFLLSAFERNPECICYDLAQVNSASNVFARIVARSKGLPLPVTSKVVYNCNTGQGWTMWKDVPFSADSGLMSVLIPVGGSLAVGIAIGRYFKK